MSDDIIRIDGVEYELERPVMHCPDGDMLYVRPKRKQTGWSCAECGARCLMRCVFTHRPTRCMFRDLAPDWQPFYGKVVE